MTAKKTRKTTFKRKLFIALGIVLLIILGGTAFNYYLKYFGPSVTGESEYLYVSTGSGFNDVYKTVRDSNIVKDSVTFRDVAHNMDYPLSVKPGKYKLDKGMSNRTLLNMLKAGNQEPVQLKFRNVRKKHTLAGLVSRNLEADSVSISRLLDSAEYLNKYGFNVENVHAMFIPNSYEIYWNTSAEQFFERMYKEYTKFWTPDRLAKASEADLTPVKVSILAAIVDGEALHDDEMPRIAGLYMNRLKKGIRLQADPTVIYANDDFTIRRVLNRHLRKESPYNTYRVRGLPPGPIHMPSVNAIDAVLNYEDNNYIFMCAKEDFSGYHRFATNHAEHMVNARKFQRALDERNIKK